MNAPTPKLSDDDLEMRVSVLEEKVDLQHHQLVHAVEQDVTDQIAKLGET